MSCIFVVMKYMLKTIHIQRAYTLRCVGQKMSFVCLSNVLRTRIVPCQNCFRMSVGKLGWPRLGWRCWGGEGGEARVGFYALASAAVERADAPGRVRRNMPDPVPVILLARLAIDAKHQGQGLGAQLLRDAITRVVAAAKIIGVRALLVHALHEQARAFYAHFDFEPSPTDPLHLLLLIKDARALLNLESSPASGDC